MHLAPLTGIETLCNICKFFWRARCISRPLRGLKLDFLRKHIHHHNDASRAPYGDWNVATWVYPLRISWCISRPLRGLKLFVSQASIFFISMHLAPLTGIETRITPTVLGDLLRCISRPSERSMLKILLCHSKKTHFSLHCFWSIGYSQSASLFVGSFRKLAPPYDMS